MRLRNTALILFGIGIALMCNWVYLSTELFYEVRTGQLNDYIPGRNDVRRYMAGWPLDYYLRVEYPSGYHYRYFSVQRLLVNAVAWLGILGALALHEWHSQLSLVRRRRAKQAASEHLPSDAASALGGASTIAVDGQIKRQFSLRDLLMLMLIVSLVLGFGRMLTTRHSAHTELAQQIARNGGWVNMSAQFPVAYALWIPHKLKQLLSRITSVSLKSPSDAQLSEVLNIAGLRGLSLSGDTYDLRLLDDIGDNPHWQQIAINERNVDAELLAALGAAKQLQSIELTETNVTGEMLRGLGEMPALTSLNLMRTNVKLDSDNVPVWGKHVQQLHLPGPQPDKTNQVKLCNWQSLVRVYCYGLDANENSQPFVLQLHDLPALKNITINARQLYDLELSHLPRLEKIDRLNWGYQTSVNVMATTSQAAIPQNWLPSAPWIRKLTTDNVPALKELKIYCDRLEEVCIDADDPLSIRLAINKELDPGTRLSGLNSGSSYTIVNGQIVMPNAGPTPPADERQAWLDRFSQSGGPHTLDLQLFPLDGLDLAPLARNTGIKSLRLSPAGVSPEQLLPLLQMKQLESLDIVGMESYGSIVEQLLTALPNLRFLNVSRDRFTSLKLDNHSQLESISGTPYEPSQTPGPSGVMASSSMYYANSYRPVRMESLHVVNMPKLAERFRLNNGSCKVHIKLAPALLGLIFAGPIPADTQLEGLRDLREFSGGGPGLTDAMAAEVLGCLQLQFLTLAHTRLDYKTVAKIAHLKQLQYLCLTGTPINEELFADWSELRQLKAFELEGTAISAEMMKTICNWQNLEELSLGNLDPFSMDALGRLSKLRVLKIARTELTEANLLVLAKLPRLNVLDLSECQLHEGALGAIANRTNPLLRLLVLKGATVPSKSLLTLAQNYAELVIDLRAVNLDSATINSLVSQNRSVILDSGNRRSLSFGASNLRYTPATTQALIQSRGSVWPGAVSAAQYRP